jgi:hypothetical protein
MFNKWLKEIKFDANGHTIINESLLDSIVIMRENGEVLDFNAYLKTLLMETLEEILGGDKDERKS